MCGRVQDYYLLRAEVPTLGSDDLYHPEDHYLASQDATTWFLLPAVDASVTSFALSLTSRFSGRRVSE